MIIMMMIMMVMLVVLALTTDDDDSDDENNDHDNSDAEKRKKNAVQTMQTLQHGPKRFKNDSTTFQKQSVNVLKFVQKWFEWPNRKWLFFFQRMRDLEFKIGIRVMPFSIILARLDLMKATCITVTLLCNFVNPIYIARK